jgi:iron-sulfur cluster insertion protein
LPVVAVALLAYMSKLKKPKGEAMLTLPPKVTPRAFERLAEIGAAAQGKALRVAVEGGGCSGFQYEIALDEVKEDDLVLSDQGETVVIDSISLPFLTDAVIDFSEELIGARFVINNPNAASSCGCGISFSM